LNLEFLPTGVPDFFEVSPSPSESGDGVGGGRGQSLNKRLVALIRL